MSFLFDKLGENGEPLVVYHGTNNNFTVFSAEKMRPGAYGDGFYFATTPERARLYGDRIITVFLNAKADNRDAKRLGVEKDYIRTSAGDIIVKNPEQIKSATDNIGTFDSQNPDIRFSISAAMPEGEGLAKIKDLLKPRKPSDRLARFSIPVNAKGHYADFAHYVVAKAILENGGRVPDAKTLDSLAKSVYYNGSKEELLRRAMKAADETRRLMRVIAMIPRVSSI